MLKAFIKEYSWLILSAILAVLTLALVIPYLRPAQTGSFEYVRKGKTLSHEGRTKEAIKYFERAYAASPENKDIMANLVYAYSQYSGELAEAKDYDKAIECLARACEIEMDSGTVQNLAIMYSRRAMAKLGKNDESGAKKDFRTAIDTAACSVSASRNLSISLYNDAVAEFKDGRNEAAVLLLKESTLAYENRFAFELLGDVYYKGTDFARARFYYEKAAQGGDNKDLVSKLQKTVKEMALTAQERSAQFPHFDIRYSKRMSMNEKEIERILEKCYFDVGSDLGYFPASKTTLFLYSREDFKDVFNMPSVVRAFYDGNIRIPIPDTSLGTGELSGYIYHEYTHAVVSAKTDNNCPVWLSEGLAVLEEYRGRDEVVLDFFSKSVYDAPLSLDGLDKAFRLKDQDEEALRVYYLLAYSVVKYMIDNWGMEGIRNILVRIKNGQHFVNAVEDEFLLSEKDFESRWQRYAFEKYLTQARSGVILEGGE